MDSTHSFLGSSLDALSLGVRMVTGSMCSSYKCADDILEFCSLFSIHFRASQFEERFGLFTLSKNSSTVSSLISYIYQSCSQVIPSAFL